MIKLPVGRGFLPPNDPPLQSSLSEHKELNELVSVGNLADGYTTGTIRARVMKNLPLYDVTDLEGQDLVAFLRDISFLASAFVHARNQPPINRLPGQLAIPLYEASKKFGKKPILSYCSYCLNNWRRLFNDGFISLDNIAIIRRFTFTRDEEWFIMIHVVIEAEAQPALRAIVAAQEALDVDDLICLERSLTIISKTLDKIYKTLCRMIEHCSPEVYYKEVRVPIMLFQNIIFEGVPELGGKPVPILRGETGAQSSIVPSLVAFLKIKHAQTGLTDFLQEMRDYMPPDHVRFIREVESAPSIREKIISLNSPVLINVYNFALMALHLFRTKHYEWANEYIFKKVANKTGTGGTPADVWLAQLRDETAAHVLVLRK